MGMISRLSKVFGSGKPEPSGPHRNGSSNGVHRNGETIPHRPVMVEPGEDGPGSMLEAKPDGPKNRQELLTELQKNYTEVVSLVRKVDQHLDEQERRSERLMEIAERMPSALEQLPAIREQNEKLTAAVERLADISAGSATRAEAAEKAQVEALGQVQTLLEQSSRAEREVAESVRSFQDTVGGMSQATETVGRVLSHIQERDAERERQLGEVLDRGARTMSVVTGLCGLGILVAITVALVALA
ncbi:MAG: hypothetical protein AAGB51_02670 [Planctomycetota bacterium]